MKVRYIAEGPIDRSLVELLLICMETSRHRLQHRRDLRGNKKTPTSIDLKSWGKDGTEVAPHQLLGVTLSNGEKYALDMTGAQFGYDESVVPWQLYSTSRVENVILTKTFGHERRRAVWDPLCNPTYYAELVMFCNREFVNIPVYLAYKTMVL